LGLWRRKVRFMWGVGSRERLGGLGGRGEEEAESGVVIRMGKEEGWREWRVG